MTKDVILSIRGMQFMADVDPEEIETVHVGQYYVKGDATYILYEEYMEGFEQPIKNTIKLKSHEMTLMRKGLVNVTMFFEEGKKNQTNYQTPFGPLVMGLDTESITVEEAEEEILVQVKYGLDVNYDFLSDCSIQISVRPCEEQKA